MVECYICDKEKTTKKWVEVPKRPILKPDGNIKDIIRDDKVPICKSHTEEKNFDMSVSYFTNRIYKDGRKRLTYRFLAPFLREEGIEEEKAKEIVTDWLKKNYKKYGTNQEERIDQILSWAEGVVKWAYRNDVSPDFSALKGLSYEVDKGD